MRVATVTIVLLLTLGGCGTSERPAPSEPTSVTTTVPSKAPPPIPAKAESFAPEGASAYLAYYVTLLNHAAATGETRPVAEASSPDCGGCSDYISFYGETHRRGGWLRDRMWRVLELDLDFDRRRGAESKAVATIEISAGLFKKDSTSPTRHLGNSKHLVTFGLRYDNGWTLTQLVAGGH